MAEEIARMKGVAETPIPCVAEVPPLDPIGFLNPRARILEKMAPVTARSSDRHPEMNRVRGDPDQYRSLSGGIP